MLLVAVVGLFGRPTTAGAADPILMLDSMQGTVTITNEDGSAVESKSGMLISPEMSIRTWDDGHVRLDLLANNEEGRQVVVSRMALAPDSHVSYRGMAWKDGDVDMPQIQLHNGMLYAVTSAKTASQPFSVAMQVGGVSFPLSGSETITWYEGETDRMHVYVRNGSCTVPIGERRIRILGSMKRAFETGNPRGAKSFEASEWQDLRETIFPADAPDIGPLTGDRELDPLPDVVAVRLVTSMGDIDLELDGKRAPVSVRNFLAYLDSNYYDGTIFHRVIDGFMIQGGGHIETMRPKGNTLPPIENEWRNGLKNVRGTIAMARLGSRPDSATCQFFINLVDNRSLDEPRDGAGYAVFGKVVRGMEVVDAIGKVKTETKLRRFPDAPVDTVLIKDVVRLDAEGNPIPHGQEPKPFNQPTKLPDVNPDTTSGHGHSHGDGHSHEHGDDHGHTH
jgi:peptidyl-prolyl cis-trans isomerase A (cyclophilin A)